MAGPRILVTSALPYVNNIPHMGNIIGCVLSADVFARYHRSIGSTVLYVCGTDEHGTATETKAIEEGLTPRQICDKYHAIHKEVYDWFQIQFDVFGRTSSENHHAIVQDIFRDVHESGFTITKDVEQSYCDTDKKFLADRFVEGTCPHCKFPNARGDQCDQCGKLLDPLELIDPKCKTCGSLPIQKKSTHLFLDLSKLQPQLQEWVDSQSKAGEWTTNAITTTQGWLTRGLEPRAITRDLTWGVPVPLPGFEGKVFYVWFDAPIGYISITGQEPEAHSPFATSTSALDWRDWWQADDVLLYQFMAKDNIPFHTILFPATMLATGNKWTMLHHIDSTEYLQHEDGKFSKSRKTGLFGDDAMRLGIPSDVYRYYLLVNRPESADTTFSWKDLQEKLNKELLANLGNLVNRTLVFIKTYQDGKVHEAVLDEKSANFLAWVQDESRIVGEEIARCKEKDALRRIMLISSKANQYFQEEQPWRTRTEDPEACRKAMFVLANIIKDLAILIGPFLPTTSLRIFEQLGMQQTAWKDLGNLTVREHAIGNPAPLFAKLEDKDIDAIKATLKGGQSAGAENSASGAEAKPAGAASSGPKPLTLKAGRIVEIDRHPDAQKLFVEKVDFGGEIRTIVSGLVGHYREDDLRGKTALFVTNLKPAKLRGVESQGMILAAQGGDGEDAKVEVVMVDAPPGTIVDGLVESPVVDSKAFGAHTIETRAGVVHLDSTPLAIGGKPVTTAMVKDGSVR
jgi:methionyl-tRNA synthetase